MKKDKKQNSKEKLSNNFLKYNNKEINVLQGFLSNRKIQKIVLLGYMASGKSVLGNELARVLNYTFVDLDTYIAKKEKLSISELFAQKGESSFRKKEFKYLKKLLNKKKTIVISLGGGTPQIGGAMKLINKKSLSIYLKASTQTLYNRLAPETTERPLLTNITEDFLQDYIQIHLEKRKKYYEKADLSIVVDDLSVHEIIISIIKEITLKLGM